MNKIDIKKLYDKDDVVAYEYLKELLNLSNINNDLYCYINDFIEMINNEKSFIQVRGFLLICANSKYDNNCIINNNIDYILTIFDSDKPTVIRQCIKALYNLVLYKKELIPIVIDKLNKIDINRYKDTVSGLIEKDIINIKKYIEKL